MYNALYDLISSAVYGGAELTPYMELTATFISTAGVAVLLLLPFVVVWKVVKTFI